MTHNDDQHAYGTVALLLHWVSVALFAVLFYLAWTMTSLPLGPEKFEKYNLHKSIGLTILALTIMRLIWRIITPAPPLPDSVPKLQRCGARLVQAALYGGIFCQASIGVVHSWLSGFPLRIYNTFNIPSPLSADSNATKLLVEIHYWVGWAIATTIVLHAGAALYHHFVLKDGVLASMVPGLARRRTTS